MKDYKQRYEGFYTSDRTLNKCKTWKVTADHDVDELTYRKQLRKLFKNYQKQTFDTLVKLTWLTKKFCYNGRLRMKMRRNGTGMDAAYGVYMRCHVGFDQRMIKNQIVYGRVISYFDDFFPDFNVRNPFEEKFEYPFSYMTFECLNMVYQMPERLDLLERGEQKKMKYREFVDYVINYALSRNDDEADELFEINFQYRTSNPFVRYKHYEAR